MKTKIAMLALLGLCVAVKAQVTEATNGNVGIGTTNPTQKLQISGTDLDRILLSNEVVNYNLNSPKLSFYGYTHGTQITGPSIQKINTNGYGRGRLAFLQHGGEDYTSETEVMSIDYNGNVGIGATSPKSKLDLGGNYSNPSTYPNKITLWSGGANNYFGFGVSEADLDYFSQFNHRFYTGYNGSPGVERMVIASNGNVGIGTTAPGSRLHINYPTSASNVSLNGITVGRGTVATSNKTSYDKGIYSGIGNFSINSGVTDSGYKIALDASSFSTTTNFQGTLKSNFGVWARAGIYQASPGARIERAVAVEAQVLDNVSGTTIDEVYGVRINTGGYNKATINKRYDLYAATTSADNYFAGNVGIGTSSPNEKLEVEGRIKAQNLTLTSTASFYSSETGKTSRRMTINTIDGDNMYLYNFDESATTFHTMNFGGAHNLNSGVTVLGNGNVGVGIANPTTKFDVSGNLKSTGTLSLRSTSESLGDIISIYGDRLGSTEMYGFGLESATLYSKAHTNHRWYIRRNADGGANAKMELNDSRLYVNGNIGIGVKDTKGFNLAVAGSTGIVAEKVTVKLQSAWPDYVFTNNYQLPTLEEVEQQIKENGHLANIPSAKEVKENGLELGEMNKKLLEKVEELTLYTIQQNKEIKKLKEENKQLKSLEERLAKLEALLNKK
ncbi:hypothetical protein [Tenacibaculum sp. 190524A05c]|uniref:hypothetical protein n=1 Tax=Tenacibaculum platacis TaxID=3137852 RepID=UPI0031FAD2D2